MTNNIQYRTDRRKDFIISLVIGLAALVIGAWGPLQVLLSGNHGDLGSYVTWGLWVSIYVYLVWAEVGMILGYYALHARAARRGHRKARPGDRTHRDLRSAHRRCSSSAWTSDTPSGRSGRSSIRTSPRR